MNKIIKNIKGKINSNLNKNKNNMKNKKIIVSLSSAVIALVVAGGIFYACNRDRSLLASVM